MEFPPPPPPGSRSGFAPPPPPPQESAAGSFAPPPPPGANRVFAPAPPQPTEAAGGPNIGPGGFTTKPPAPTATGRNGGFLAPPPPIQQVNKGIANMSFLPPPPPPPPGLHTGGAPPPPAIPGQLGMNRRSTGGPPPPAPGQFQPASAAPGISNATPRPPHPPGQFGMNSRGPPPPPGASGSGPNMVPGMGAPSMAPGMAHGMRAHGLGLGQQQQNIFQENIDFNIRIPERFFKLTCEKIPSTNNVAMQSKVPIGGILRPLAPRTVDEDDVDVIQPGSAGIIRCKRCRTYMNAFVHWLEHGRSWRCNLCAQVNTTPSAYFCHLDDEGFRRDRFDRPELSKSVVEFIAPAEYMVRPPQEPTYFFVLDVSAQAVHSGMLECAASAIKRSLDDLSGGRRTKIGFITFENSVHYFNLSADLAQPQMLVVSSLKELFVPLPDSLLVNLVESRSVVDTFLDNLPEMFTKNPVTGQSCLGPALKAAFTVMKQVGGKMVVFQSIQPNLGDGSLKPRENPSIMGTGAEVKLLRSDSPWYKDTAIEFSRQQISVDMFLFPYSYIDIASLGDLPKYSAGSLHSYVMFNLDKDGPRLEEQINKTLTENTAFEAVMRTRVTKGMRITNYYGNFYIRGADLMALPNVNSDSVFGFDLAHDGENLASNHVTVQSALLYTNGHGQRRIRVMTQAFQTTSLTSELVNTVDVFSTCTLLAKQAIDITLKTNLDNARMRLQQACVDLIRSAKGGDRRVVSGYSVPQDPQSNEQEEDNSLPESLELFPLYTLALMKNVAFRGGTDVHPDERCQAFFKINQMWLDKSKSFIYPTLFSLHDMQSSAGYPSEDSDDDSPPLNSYAGRNRVLLPGALPLTLDSLSSDGLFLVDNGIEFYFWVGNQADSNLVNSLFGVPSLNNVEPLLNLDNLDEFSTRIANIISALRDDANDPYRLSSKITVVKEGDQYMESRFFWFMVEDSASFNGGTFSYEDFMNFVQNPNAGPGGGPPGPARGMGPGAGYSRSGNAPTGHPKNQYGLSPQPHITSFNQGFSALQQEHHGQATAPRSSLTQGLSALEKIQYGQGPPAPSQQKRYDQLPAPPQQHHAPPPPPPPAPTRSMPPSSNRARGPPPPPPGRGPPPPPPRRLAPAVQRNL